MENALLSSNLYSHPDKLLETHLINVANFAKENLNQAPIARLLGLDKQILYDVLNIASLCHDIGKSTDYFQHYLFAGEKEKQSLKNKPETHHSLLSAIVAFYETEAYVETKGIQNSNIILPFIAYLTVKRHHGDFDDAKYEMVLEENDISVLKNQIEHINETALYNLNNHLRIEGLLVDISKEQLFKWISNFQKDVRPIKREIRNLKDEKNFEIYLTINIMFSCLIDADKSDVGVGKLLSRSHLYLDQNIVQGYKESKQYPTSPLNNLRESAYQDVLNEPIDLKNHIYSINLPTGIGKTLISLAFSFKLRRNIYTQKGHMPRIVYSLPFLSIIDQNYDEIKKVFENAGIKIDSSILLKHHHLSEIYYKKDSKEFETDEAKILIEGWNSEFIVTTFMQLFYSLITNKNSNLRKLHRLSGSIIILDEIQSIPFEYWPLLNNLLKELTSSFDVYIIFVTATEPLIFNKTEIFSLTKPEQYFKELSRTILYANIDNDLTISEFFNCCKLDGSKSYLFIFNTIASAKDFYSLLKEQLPSEAIIFLSSHITPSERLERINNIKQKKSRLAVTTQLVEAGVDIDFDVVYRDMAPLDSIIQSAGRCNRNWTSQGEVHIVSLKDEKRRYASYIYDPVLLDTTKEILKERLTIQEYDLYSIVNGYYKKLQSRKASDQSKYLIEALYSLKYDSSDETIGISDFKLIKEDYPKVDVFIEINEKAMDLWNTYQKLKEINNIYERRNEFSKIKADFYKYVISVPERIENIPPEVSGIRYVNKASLSDYYDQETGFKVKREVAIW